MMKTRIAIAQINPSVGDLTANTGMILESIRQARSRTAHLVVFPELALTGYPPEDLLFKPDFVRDTSRFLDRIARSTAGISVILGYVDKCGGHLYNAAAFIDRSRVRAVYHKMLLPNYGVFDEKRYFTPGEKPLAVSFGPDGLKACVTICEDIWEKASPAFAKIASLTPDLIVNISASPYHYEKQPLRDRTLTAVAKKHGCPLVYCNMVGGQDELVFDGSSAVLDSRGRTVYRAPRFRSHQAIVSFEKGRNAALAVTTPRSARQPGTLAEIFESLVLGTGDYLRKNGFSKAVVGLSGGIDSSLTAAIACEALGSENVIGVSMPSRFTSRETKDDAKRLALNLGIAFQVMPIDDIFDRYLGTLDPAFSGMKRDTTEENLQARIRGNLLMALSNKFGWLVLATGNKSEISMGYCTLYGDMAGGYAVIKDVPKTLVYRLTRYANARMKRPGAASVIPSSVIRRAPTAELRFNQKDEDTLPPYRILDPILHMYIEEAMPLEAIAKKAGNKGLARSIVNTVDRNEYKRRQSPPGVKISPLAFGRDRRFPIVNHYKA